MATLSRWEPFRGMVSLRDAMDRLIEESIVRPFENWPFVEGNGAHVLAIDVYETEENLIIEASLPGLDPADVDISVIGNTLTIKGETRHEEAQEEKGKYYYRERQFGAFKRTITLPVEVNANAAEAIYKNGMLELTLPKIEEAKPKHIDITVK